MLAVTWDAGGVSQQYDPAQQMPPSGWYPDPVDHTQERFWDGTSWTTRQRPPATQQQPLYDQQVPAAQPGQAGYPSSGYPQAGYEAQAGYPQVGYPSSGYPQAGYEVQGYSQYRAAGRGPTTADGVPLSGWWRRAGATILDSLIIGVLSSIAILPFLNTLTAGMEAWMSDLILAAQTGGAAPLYTDPQYGLSGPLTTIYIISLLISVVYATAMLIWKSATLGQLAMGLRVVPLDKGRQQQGLSFATSLLRNVAYYALSAITFVALINVLVPLGNMRRQALHDMIARTQVVKIR